MKIEIRKQVTLAGQVVRIGEVVEASPSDTTILLGQAAAVPYVEPVQPEEKPVQCPMPTKAKPKRQRRAANDRTESE